jgi:hypothetical protein
MAEVTLDSVVELAMRCEEECKRRAERFVVDVNPVMTLSKTVTETNHQLRHDEAVAKCRDACASVIGQCPAPEQVRKLLAEQAQMAKTAGGAAAAGPTPLSGNAVVFHEPQFQLRRCEAAATTFVNVLFWMANAPTRYELAMRDFSDQRARDRAGPAGAALRETAANRNKLGGDDLITLNSGGGPMIDEHGLPVRPGTGHLTPEQRARLEEIAAKSNASSVKSWTR